MANPKPNKSDTGGSIEAFVDSAIDAFELAGPVYRFGFCPSGESGPQDRLREGFPEGVYVDFAWDQEVEIERLPFADGAARTVLCVDAPGNAFEPRRAMGEMIRILAPGGALLVCVSVASRVPERGGACWQLTPRGLDQLLSGMEARLVGWEGGEGMAHTLYAVGFKPPLSDVVLKGINRFLDRFPARIERLSKGGGWGGRLKRLLRDWAAKAWPRRGRRDQGGLQFVVHFSVDRNLKHDLLEGCMPSDVTGTRLDLRE